MRGRLPFSSRPSAGRRVSMAAESPVVLVKWYDVVKWFLERIDSFPKNQRFVFGQRLADRAIDVLELLVEAAYSPRKADLLSRANRDIEVLRWLVRLAKDRDLFTMRQYGFSGSFRGLRGGSWNNNSNNLASSNRNNNNPTNENNNIGFRVASP